MKLTPPTLTHKLPRPRLGLAVLGSLALAATTLTLVTQAAPSVVPGSCAALDQKYFHSGHLFARVPYTLASQTTHIGTSVGVVSYSEGTLSLQPAAGLSGFLNGQGLQYFNDRRYIDNGASEPFNPAATDNLGVTLGEVPGSPAKLEAQLNLLSWGDAVETINIQGCIGDNIVYGTVSTNKGDSLVSIALKQLIVDRP